MTDRAADVRHRPVLSEKARRAVGPPVDDRPVELVMVPLLRVPMRDDAKDRR